MVKDKEEEIERLERISKFISPKKIKSRESSSPEKRRSDPDVDSLASDMVKELSSNFGISDQDTLRKIACAFLSKAKSRPEESNGPSNGVTVKKENENQGVISKLQDELMQERERNNKLKSEHEKMSQEYDKTIRKSIPNFDEMKDKIVSETLTKERSKHEREKNIILKDLQSRVDKVVKLEMELDEERDKNRTLEATMTDGEKILKKKVNTLENNLEQLTQMYHQLNTQKSTLKVDNQVTEKKLARKTERILGLEKQLLDTKELVGEYKNKIESLKSLISVSGNTNVPLNQIYTEGMENMDLNYQESFLMTPDSKGQSSIHARKPSSNNAKIVKHIRGGQSKKSLSGNPQLLHALKQNSLNNFGPKQEETVQEFNNKQSE
jgi:hypothetical protein